MPEPSPERRASGNNSVLEFGVAHKRRALHRMAALVVVDAGPPEVSVRIFLITRADRFGVLKILMKGMNNGTSSGMMYF